MLWQSNTQNGPGQGETKMTSPTDPEAEPM